MATSTPLSRPAKAYGQPQLSWTKALVHWHLYSFDAPCVAMLWTWFIARSSHLRLGPKPIACMGLAVWLLYASDRLLDTRLDSGLQSRDGARDHTGAYRQLERRHLFHRQHSAAFRLGIVCSTFLLVFLIPHLPVASLRLYAILGALLAAYFFLVHTQSSLAPRLPKEIAVGIFFSAATFIPTIARRPAVRPLLLVPALLLGFVCALNCLFIYAWEHPAPYPLAHPMTRSALRVLVPLSCAVGLLAAASVLLPTVSPQLPVSVTLAATLLLLLHRNRSRIAPTTLRAAADLCLLTPLLFVFSLAA